MALLSTVFTYAVRTGLLDTSPAVGMNFLARSKEHDAEGKRQPFSEDAVKRFFGSPPYAGCASKVGRSVSGPQVIKDAMYWIGLILFYSGMRLEEAGGLRGKDVQQRDGMWGFSLEPSEGRSLKTVTAARFVPCHPILLNAGLLELAKKRGDGWLFPELVADHNGKRTSALSKAFGRYLKKRDCIDIWVYRDRSHRGWQLPPLDKCRADCSCASRKPSGATQE